MAQTIEGETMNDYWNDPPDYPEPPECPNDKQNCDGSGEYLYDGKTGMVFSCDTCGYQWVIPFPADPEPESEGTFTYEVNETPVPCPHGKLESCDACDHLSDIAYDTARENRVFGR
jgi:hypothetical protein